MNFLVSKYAVFVDTNLLYFVIFVDIEAVIAAELIFPLQAVRMLVMVLHPVNFQLATGLLAPHR